MAFEQIKLSLRNTMGFYHREPAKIVSVHADASDKLCSESVQQCDLEELRKQKH